MTQKFQERVLKEHWWLYTRAVLRGHSHTLVYEGDRRWGQSPWQGIMLGFQAAFHSVTSCAGMFEDLKTHSRGVLRELLVYILQNREYFCVTKKHLYLVTGTHLEKGLPENILNY